MIASRDLPVTPGAVGPRPSDHAPLERYMGTVWELPKRRLGGWRSALYQVVDVYPGTRDVGPMALLYHLVRAPERGAGWFRRARRMSGRVEMLRYIDHSGLYYGQVVKREKVANTEPYARWPAVRVARYPGAESERP